VESRTAQPVQSNPGGVSGPTAPPAGNQQSNWVRQSLPQPDPRKGGHGGRGGRGGGDRRGGRYEQQQQSFFDGPVKPLDQSENRWVPVKDNSVTAATEKKVNSILNKMTREKFEKLAGQICDIPIESRKVLEIIIEKVFEKAIDEPAFGGIYAELCKRMADRVTPESFIHVIPHVNSKGEGKSFQWSSDVGTADTEIIGPYPTVKECTEAALDGANRPDPVIRGDINVN